MAKKIKLKSYKKLSINDKKNEFLRPDFVYIPLVAHTNPCDSVVKIGDKVTKGMVIGNRNSDQFPIISTVSGVVTEITDMLYLNGKMVSTVVIKNDFKEKTVKVNTLTDDISKISKDELIDRLKKLGVSGLSGNDFSTYIKYNCNAEYTTLLVNGAECEPFITSDYHMMRYQSEEILETVDAIITIMGLKRGVISFKEDHKEIKAIFDSISGTYPNIDIMTVKNYYPVGWEKRLVKDVLHLSYKARASEVGVLVNNVSTIYSIYHALKYNKPLTEKYVTITGNAIKEPQNVLVKIGSRVDELLSFVGGYEDDTELILIADGPMMGKALESSLTMVVKPLNGVIVNKYIKQIETECMKCGKCVEVCPVHLSPVLIAKNLNNVKALKKLHAEKCIGCGLCSYVCPANIDVREQVKAGNGEVVK